MPSYRWFMNKIEAIAMRLERGPVSEAKFQKAVERIEALAEKAAAKLAAARDVDETPMAILVDGTAEAVGQNTHATGNLRASLTDYGALSVGVGYARFEAAACGGQEVAFADAGSLISGADLVLTADIRTTGRNWETAEHRFVAIDLDCVDLARPISFGVGVERTSRTAWSVAEGNLATAEFDVAVEAENSFADVTVDVLTVEDLYSGSTVEGALAIG